MPETLKVAMIGFGEAGAAFAEGWQQRDGDGSVSLKAFDVKTQSDATRMEMMARYAQYGVEGCDLLADAVADCDVIFSFVTADRAQEAARSVLGLCREGTLFFDCNSCAPDTKRGSAKLIEADGGHYVDVAVMAPVHPNLHQTKVHICGPHSAAAEAQMLALNMNVTVMDGEVGHASATKMVRSIMMKGLEAVMVECVLAGRKAGVDELVLDSLDKTYPGFNFREKAAYMLERVMVHGVRRAAELREVALTVEQLGLDNDMSSATVEWQQRIGEMKLDPDMSLGPEDYRQRADIVLAALNGGKANN
jgi:3-hydroxyisobutyrate dehydrogenase-like beta-hydroxyacid dehydrogenase